VRRSIVRNVIEIEGLGKHYRRRARVTAAVDGLDLVVPEGGVFGFLGPNGSGKTTTIRCVLGLARPTAGSVRLLGCRVPGDVRDAVRRTGAIVETPASFPTMTARENLRLLASIDGIGRRRVDEVLQEVGLGERAGDLVKRFSLGMRQRLALASVLLKDPELLILDEPRTASILPGCGRSVGCSAGSATRAGRCSCRVTSSPRSRPRAIGWRSSPRDGA
jgi:ABC-2 type transport system ATP-binding protein